MRKRDVFFLTGARTRIGRVNRANKRLFILDYNLIRLYNLIYFKLI
jgi:hypothetical protein